MKNEGKLIIQYDMAYKIGGRTIHETRDMCGRFDSPESFESFKRREEYYNRFVTNARIVRVKEY